MDLTQEGPANNCLGCGLHEMDLKHTPERVY